MPAPFTRTLTFMTDLGVDAILLLTFSRFPDGMYHDKFPICWQVIKCPSTGPCSATATYRNQLAFFRPQIDLASDMVVPVDDPIYKSIDVGQKTTLIQDDDGVYKFTDPEADSGNYVKALNGTAQEETIGVGFLNKDDSVPTPLFVFNVVGTGITVEVQFTPILRAYITSNFQETQIIRGEMDTATLLWEYDLAALADRTVWELKHDSTSGFKIQSV